MADRLRPLIVGILIAAAGFEMLSRLGLLETFGLPKGWPRGYFKDVPMFGKLPGG